MARRPRRRAARGARGLLFAVVVVPVVAALGCDVRRLVLESDILPAQRDEWVRECCECLAHGQTAQRGDACAGAELPAPDDDDGGPLVLNPCLCDVDAESCSELLVAGAPVDVVGGCTVLGGSCHYACDGVLAYP